MLHGNRTSWELYKEMCCVFTTICRNVLFRQISEFKIWDFLLPLFIHTSFLDILKLRGTNFLSTDKHERVETMFSRCWNKYFVYLFQTEHFKYLHLWHKKYLRTQRLRQESNFPSLFQWFNCIAAVLHFSIALHSNRTSLKSFVNIYFYHICLMQKWLGRHFFFPFKLIE